MTRHGGQILADQLRIQGCDRVYCVPGESFLAALDGLRDISEIQTIVCRQEGGAAMMAEAAGKLSGRPGVCMVTRVHMLFVIHCVQMEKGRRRLSCKRKGSVE